MEKDSMYNFNFEKLNREIKKRRAKKVLVQLPEGLKPKAVEIIENINAECVFSADPCFGACDIMTIPNCDLTVHFGHSKIYKEKHAIYMPVSVELDPLPAVVKALEILPEKRIGLVATVQHVNELSKIKKFLETKKKKVFVGGQVLGCNFMGAKNVAKKVDVFLFIGSGRFHPLGVSYFSKKRTVSADPYLNRAEEVRGDWEKEKLLRMEKAREAGYFGIVVCSKPGQKHWDIARETKKRVEARNKRAFYIYMNEISPDRLDYLPFDAFIITACPRIVLDDWKNYKKPILLPDEV